jgi:hypothetical protein
VRYNGRNGPKLVGVLLHENHDDLSWCMKGKHAYLERYGPEEQQMFDLTDATSLK